MQNSAGRVQMSSLRQEVLKFQPWSFWTQTSACVVVDLCARQRLSLLIHLILSVVILFPINDMMVPPVNGEFLLDGGRLSYNIRVFFFFTGLSFTQQFFHHFVMFIFMFIFMFILKSSLAELKSANSCLPRNIPAAPVTCLSSDRLFCVVSMFPRQSVTSVKRWHNNSHIWSSGSCHLTPERLTNAFVCCK